MSTLNPGGEHRTVLMNDDELVLKIKLPRGVGYVLIMADDTDGTAHRRPMVEVRGPKGESRWVNIPADRYAAVVHAASTPPSTQYCHCCTDNQCECEGIALRRDEPAVVIGDLEI